MATGFGKFLRKLRIDSDETQGDMAKKLDVAQSFLSAVENGKKDIPKSLCRKILDLYPLSMEQKYQLTMFFVESVKSIDNTNQNI